MSDICFIFLEPFPWRWWYIQCPIIQWHHIIILIIPSVIRNVDKIVITELRIGILCHDLTLVQSEMVEL